MGDDGSSQIQKTPGILPGSDSPALERPLSVKGVQANSVDDVPGTEAGFIPGFHIRGAMGKEIRFAAQIRRVAGKIPEDRELFLRNGLH